MIIIYYNCTYHLRLSTLYSATVLSVSAWESSGNLQHFLNDLQQKHVSKSGFIVLKMSSQIYVYQNRILTTFFRCCIAYSIPELYPQFCAKVLISCRSPSRFKTEIQRFQVILDHSESGVTWSVWWSSVDRWSLDYNTGGRHTVNSKQCVACIVHYISFRKLTVLTICLRHEILMICTKDMCFWCDIIVTVHLFIHFWYAPVGPA